EAGGFTPVLWAFLWGVSSFACAEEAREVPRWGFGSLRWRGSFRLRGGQLGFRLREGGARAFVCAEEVGVLPARRTPRRTSSHGEVERGVVGVVGHVRLQSLLFVILLLKLIRLRGPRETMMRMRILVFWMTRSILSFSFYNLENNLTFAVNFLMRH
ncbi:hypothetical protein Taro_021535, partial [Colocasia esculenta]|nr:hypothetical protein [Colocasia esculenta]